MKLCYLLLCFILLSAFSSTEEEPAYDKVYLEKKIAVKEIKKEDWAKATEGLNYEETIKPKTPKKKRKKDSAALATFFKMLLIFTIVLIVLLLLRYLVGAQGIQQSKNKTFDPNAEIDTQTIAADIHEYDLNTLLQQAIDQGAYNVATRLYYLLAIKNLADENLIKWTKDKTNRHYINEISTLSIKKEFRALTNIFERVWYGETIIDKTIFEQIRQPFQQFIQKTSKS